MIRFLLIAAASVAATKPALADWADKFVEQGIIKPSEKDEWRNAFNELNRRLAAGGKVVLGTADECDQMNLARINICITRPE